MPRFLGLICGALFLLPLSCAVGAETANDVPELLHFTEKDLPTDEKDPAGPSEIEELANARGFRYGRDTRRAAQGDPKALKAFFQLAQDADGAAAEIINGMPTVVYHILGDAKFARFLAGQPLPFRMMVRNHVADGAYLSRYFPETTKLLYEREMVGWSSPDERYAIRKVFSDELQLAGSKVVRAELIEKKTGRVLCDLTPDDIGTGADREGEALWSPDSKRVACLSSDLTQQEGDMFGTPPPAPLRKQTAVYQLMGDSFARVALPLGEAPQPEGDHELDRTALGHKYTEPVRWQRPNVLILQRHEYYRKLVPTKIGDSTFDSIQDLGRSFQIAATIDPDGKSHVTWKRVED
jgi:hypothetical protein